MPPGGWAGKAVDHPQQTPHVETVASHMAADAKVLDENKDRGLEKYSYIRTGADHFSFALASA